MEDKIKDNVTDDTIVIGTLNKKRKRKRKKNGLDKTITIDTTEIKETMEKEDKTLEVVEEKEELKEIVEDKELALEQTSSLELEEITKSLKVLDSNDYNLINTKKQKEISMIIQLIVIVFLLLITFFVTYFHIVNRNKNTSSYVNENINIKDKQEYIKELNNLNPDIIGYVDILGTNISYPVLYSDTYDYSNHDMYHNTSEDGSVFIDKYNNLNPRDTNLLIYAHSSKNSSKFYDLSKYKNKDYYTSHKTLKYYTLDSVETYEVIGVFNSYVYEVNDSNFKYYKFYNAGDVATYDYYISNVKSKSLYDINLTANYKENLITLSTLDYHDNGRMVVVFKKIK